MKNTTTMIYLLLIIIFALGIGMIINKINIIEGLGVGGLGVGGLGVGGLGGPGLDGLGVGPVGDGVIRNNIVRNNAIYYGGNETNVYPLIGQRLHPYIN